MPGPVPALEWRLAGSPLGRFSGELRLSFYRQGLRLVLFEVRLKVAEPVPAIGGAGNSS